MAKLTSFCPECGKQAITESQTTDDFLEMKVIRLKCGHRIIEELQKEEPWELVRSVQGFKPYPYQGEGYDFARRSNFRCLIADEPGLGKTIQALLCLKLHLQELAPILIVVKSSLIAQWIKQLIYWCGPDFIPDVIRTGKDRPSKDFDIIIVTYDLLNRINGKEREKQEQAENSYKERNGLTEWEPIPEEDLAKLYKARNYFTEFGFKTVILDECQQIKSESSKRTMEVREICKSVPHVIALSGTPIKNNGGEYFPILNILDSKHFAKQREFVEEYCDFVETQYGYKVGGIRDMQKFAELTKDYIIRRTRNEVLPDLPVLNRKFVHCEFASDKMEREYNEMQEEFSNYFYEHEGDEGFYKNILDKINKLRHKVGINKVPFCADFIMDFILDTNRKLVVFTHHLDVAGGLEAKLNSEFNKMRKEGSQILNPLRYSSDLNPMQRDEVISTFESNPNARILIASGLASGEGLNLQFCSDCIVLERQWNPANEEQMEGRFIRIGATCRNCGARQESGLQEKSVCTACGLELKVDAHYILTTGTIDEYFTELVEYKRSIMGQVLDKKENSQWSEEGLMKELALLIASKGGKKWKLS